MENQMNESIMAPERNIKSGAGLKGNRTLLLSITAILTALETVSTMMITVPIPGSNGYFNIGESIIYFSAILFGAGVGAFVGGVGAALADIMLGYAFFSPGTLVVKALEGFIVGKLYEKLRTVKVLERHWKTISIGAGIIFSGILLGIGLYIPEIDVKIALTLAIILLVFILALGLTVKPITGIRVISIVAGGAWMVLGYFLYISFILNSIKPGFYMEWDAASAIAAALWEVPWDIMQVLISLIIAIPVIAALEPLLKKYDVN